MLIFFSYFGQSMHRPPNTCAKSGSMHFKSLKVETLFVLSIGRYHLFPLLPNCLQSILPSFNCLKSKHWTTGIYSNIISSGTFPSSSEEELDTVAKIGFLSVLV